MSKKTKIDTVREAMSLAVATGAPLALQDEAPLSFRDDADTLDVLEKDTSAAWVPIDTLSEWDENPRQITPIAVKKVAQSIQRFGFASPLVVRLANRRIICGHTRFRAAKSLGMTRVPVRFVDLDERDARMLALADNRTGEETEWDDDKLAAALLNLKGSGADLSCLGFDTFELADAVRVTEELALNAPRVERVDEMELVTFRIYKMQVPLDVANEFDMQIRRYGEERGTFNGFLEHVLALLEADSAA